MNEENKIYKILLTGGGSGGSVTPLLAVADELNHETKFEFLWLGTKFGPEKEMVENAGIKFRAIMGGKWRRYFSLKNLLDIFKIKIALWQSFFIILKWRPDLVMSAGSFISVPVVWAGWLLRVPVIIHQQDLEPGLANKLMAPFAKTITVTFGKSLIDYGKKAIWIGNPTRRNLETTNLKSQFPINNSLPVVLILGGGTGAMAINNLVAESLAELTKFCQVLHVTGKEKGEMINESKVTNYDKYEFLAAGRMAEALKLADIVVTRAGIGFLTELSYLGKPTIIIPMPETHQEANANFFKSKKAAITVEQKYLTKKNFSEMIQALLDNEDRRKLLSTNMKQAMKAGANQAMVKIIKDILK